MTDDGVVFVTVDPASAAAQAALRRPRGPGTRPRRPALDALEAAARGLGYDRVRLDSHEAHGRSPRPVAPRTGSTTAETDSITPRTGSREWSMSIERRGTGDGRDAV